MMSLGEIKVQKTKENLFAIHLMTSYPENLTVKKLIQMGFFIFIKITYISSSNDPNITHTKNNLGLAALSLKPVFHFARIVPKHTGEHA
jgi:hypothetical protein